MKRSEVNAVMKSGDEFAKANKFYLPPFAYWSPSDWKHKGDEVSEIVNMKMGWDITDWGSGNFQKLGLFMFTIRNGSHKFLKDLSGKIYAEKLLIVDRDQLTPMHYHWTKMEDIINRGGGDLCLRLHNSTPENGLADSPVTVSIDGVRRTFSPGEVVTLHRGESITLTQGLYHEFWGEKEKVLVIEVSVCNDDDTDNQFYDTIGRFPLIEEDEEPLHLLLKDYPKYYQSGVA